MVIGRKSKKIDTRIKDESVEQVDSFKYLGCNISSNVLTPVVPWLSYSLLDPRFAGSNPGRNDGLFYSVKILSMTSFGREVKRGSRVVDLRHVKKPQVEIRASGQNLSAFSRSL